MGFLCCQPWQRSAWPHHCPHTPAGSSFSSREGNLLCCCPFCACSAEFKCHPCDTIWGKTQTNLESLTSTHGGEKKKGKPFRKAAPTVTPQQWELLWGFPVGTPRATKSSWKLKAAGEVAKLSHTSLGRGASPWQRPICHKTCTSIIWRANSKKISKGGCQPSSASGCSKETPALQTQPDRCGVPRGDTLSVVGWGRRVWFAQVQRSQGRGLDVAPLSCLYPEILEMRSHSHMSGKNHQYRKLPVWQDVFFRRKHQG